MEQVVVNIGIIIAYILVALGALLAVVFPLVNAVSQPKLLIKAGIGFVGVIVIFGIGYALSDSTLTGKFIQYGVDTGSLSQAIGGALKMVYLLMGIAILGIAFTEFSKAFK
jgi:hypothetical protein